MDQVSTPAVILVIHPLNTCWFPRSARRLVPGAGVQPDAALLGGVHDRTPVGPLPRAARLRLQQAVRPGSPLLQGQQQGGLTGRHTLTHSHTRTHTHTHARARARPRSHSVSINQQTN